MRCEHLRDRRVRLCFRAWSTKCRRLFPNSEIRVSNERAVMERKLKAMIAMKLPYVVDGVARVAWPQDILYENGMMV